MRLIKRPRIPHLVPHDKRPNKKKSVRCSARPCVDTESSERCTNELSRKWRILTYCCRNVSVGRVIGIHIGRVMGGREHSVVVDSESWTKTTETQWFTPIQTHDRGHKRTVTGRQWEGRGAQVWDRVMEALAEARPVSSSLNSTHHTHVYTWSLFNSIISLKLALTNVAANSMHVGEIKKSLRCRIMIYSLHFCQTFSTSRSQETACKL